MLTFITVIGFIIGFVTVFYLITPFTEDVEEFTTDEEENRKYMIDLSQLTWWKKD